MIRSALFVEDLDAQKRFYQKVFGFNQVYFEGVLSTPAAARVVGAPEGAELRCCIVRGDAPNVGMVGLFRLDPLPPAIQRPGEGVARGESVLVFYCLDLDNVIRDAVAFGASVVCEPLDFNMPHESQREAMIRDPEGFAINLVERDPMRAFSTGVVPAA